MGVKVRKLKCRVRIAGKSQQESRLKDVDKERPSMTFALPPAEVRAEQPLEPMETSSSTSGVENDLEQSASIDPRLIADRVYELMRREIQLGRQRGERN